MNHTKRILIVEDENIVRLLRIKFEKEGYGVDIARGGHEAMRKIRENRPDLVLLDLLLPEADGFSVLKQIRTDDGLKGIPVIIFSNLSNQASIDRARALGISDYIIKSDIDLESLILKISAYLKEK